MRTKALFIALAVAAVCSAKTIKTVILHTAPEMHCESCENRIKSNIRFEKGVKDIVTNLTDKTVTIQYDADKTNVENIIAGFKKINYVASVAEPAQQKCDKKEGTCCEKKDGTCEKKADGGCCGGKKAEGTCCEKKTDATTGASKQAEKKGGTCCEKK